MSRLFLTIAAVAASLAFGDIALAQTPPTPPAVTPPATETPAATPAKKGKKQTRQQEADSAMKSGTVPKRYMQNVPKEYHHLIPFSK